jgi:S1-C subfamily serine protease
LKKLFLPIILAIFVITGILATGCQGVGGTTTTTIVNSVPQGNLQSLPTVSQVVARVEPAVVAIDITFTSYDFFGRPVQGSGAGSGWIIDSSGYIVTNNHVIDGAKTISVTLQDGRTFDASQVSSDKVNDLAVIKIDAEDLPVASTGDSSQLAVGDWVVAIGNSFGMGTSATVGIVSALDVTLDLSGENLSGLIQTDAAINPGNSGGPLINMAGEVVGINSAKIQNVGVEGMGYAISINQALPSILDLLGK